MNKNTKSTSINVAEKVRKQIESGGERFWKLADFKNMSFTAVTKALSRLFQQGIIQRLGKGLYYRPRETTFGPSKPNFNLISDKSLKKRGVFPAGNAAANLLGFTTQNTAKKEIATYKLSLPRLIVGTKTVVHTRRPESWKNLSDKDAAILDFLRQSGRTSELTLEDTVAMLLKHLRQEGQFERIMKIAESEPPRVRAILGAIGQQLRCKKKYLLVLKKSLNPLSKFDFGNLITLKYAKQWQAKDIKPHETI